MADTKVICGGVYEAEMFGNKVRCVMIASTNEGKKGATGLLQVRGQAAEHVVEGSTRL
nr:hypothetical protein [Anaerolineae bacterium]NIN96839.1 hypothetical protein [Anaerolineae bacterium]NIQ82686.1 hypothetical protein [Anaerolineae bacterium]